MVVRLTGSGGKARGKVRYVAFHLGKRRIGTDTEAPFRISRPAHKLVNTRGKVRVTVTLRHASERLTRRLAVLRPSCIRR